MLHVWHPLSGTDIHNVLVITRLTEIELIKCNFKASTLSFKKITSNFNYANFKFGTIIQIKCLVALISVHRLNCVCTKIKADKTNH